MKFADHKLNISYSNSFFFFFLAWNIIHLWNYLSLDISEVISSAHFKGVSISVSIQHYFRKVLKQGFILIFIVPYTHWKSKEDRTSECVWFTLCPKEAQLQERIVPERRLSKLCLKACVVQVWKLMDRLFLSSLLISSKLSQRSGVRLNWDLNVVQSRLDLSIQL